MKTRVISGVVIAVILLAVALLMFTPVFDIFFAVLAAAACYEITKVAGVKDRTLTVTAIVFSGILPLFTVYLPEALKFRGLGILGTAYILLLILLTLAHHENVSFSDFAVTVYSSLIIPLAFTSLLMISNLYELFPGNIDRAETAFFTWTAVTAALITDVFAYFTGSKFGRHKMTPKLSPHKSWEGAAGGVIGSVIFAFIFLEIFKRFFTEKPFFMETWAFLLTVAAVSVLSMFGDLMASFIKRNYGAKDFSNLIPGHGGIMDRFDSVLVAAPVLYLFVNIYGLVVFP